MTTPVQPARHTVIEDLQGIAFGTTMAAVSIAILAHLGMITGQTAGLAVMISYVSGWPFGLVFFAINLPFYWLGWRRMGAVFAIKTFVAVGALSVLSVFIPRWISFDTLDPIFGAVLFGFVSGAGLLALFRHGASLGGVGIVALYLQDRTGLRAGHTQLIFDACLFALAFFLFDMKTVALSFLGAVVVNLVIAINHRRDRYVAT